jgi:predicted ATPase
MISRLFVDNYKCFVNFEIRLDELTLLVGRNGVGKSSVLDVVLALRKLLRGEARITDPSIFHTRTLTRWQRQTVQAFEIEVSIDEETFVYRLEVDHETSTRKARVVLESLSIGGRPLFQFSLGRVHLYRDDHTPGPEFQADWTESALARVASTKDNLRLTRFLEFARSISVLRLVPSALLTESFTEDSALLVDGSNFAAWYRHVSQEYPEQLHGLFKELSGVIDGFRSIRLEKNGPEARSFLVVFEGEDLWFRLDELSDGQRALVVLYSILHLTGGRSAALFLDEPDNFVALAEIQPWLQALTDACGEGLGQAVVCSHHPELIDYLGPSHGLTLSREKSGVTRVGELVAGDFEGTLKLSELVARGWES